MFIKLKSYTYSEIVPVIIYRYVFILFSNSILFFMLYTFLSLLIIIFVVLPNGVNHQIKFYKANFLY